MPTWVRCRDRDTGHEYDLHVKDFRVLTGLVEVLIDYPQNNGIHPRPAKHRVDKGANPATRANKSRKKRRALNG